MAKEKVDKRKGEDAMASFKVNFTDEQKDARRVIHDNVMTVLTGRAGTSKTFIAASVAIELLMKKTRKNELPYTPKVEMDYKAIDKIIITRPTVEAGESIGFLKGDAFDLKEGKMGAYLSPIMSNFETLVGKDTLDAWINSEHCPIVTIPIQFMRGHTFSNCVVIADESQNIDLEQFKLLSSRIGHNSKLIVTSDLKQCDLADKSKSASTWMEKTFGLDGIGTFELKTNFRHPLAISIMDILEAEEFKRERASTPFKSTAEVIEG